MTFWAYILRCADGSYYTGHNDNLEARIASHQSGQTAGHTRKRRPVTLAWSQDFSSRLEAWEAERRIKGWTRAKKEALIAGDWNRPSHLACSRQGGPSTGSGRTVLEGGHIPSPVRPEPVEGRLAPSLEAPISLFRNAAP
ncbi:GIY-YIG nuclease family protein [Sphingomonas koreensis]|nr:GIY-YIG nuclease family protein [Sphingomonas koreensis]